MAKLGFVGLGIMGGRIAKRLLDAGNDVTGHNRTRSKAEWLLEAGMRWADTPRVVAESADVVFTMVTDTGALQAVIDGPDGLLAGLAPGKVFVDMSSISPAASRELATRVAGTGAPGPDRRSGRVSQRPRQGAAPGDGERHDHAAPAAGLRHR